MTLVIDTSVLGTADEATDMTLAASAIDLLDRVGRRHTVFLDREGFIRTEYGRHGIYSPNSFAGDWWLSITGRQGAISYVTGVLEELHRDYLEQHGGDDDDFAFCGTAKNANAEIVHEDSDYENDAVHHKGARAMRIMVALNHISA